MILAGDGGTLLPVVSIDVLMLSVVSKARREEEVALRLTYTRLSRRLTNFSSPVRTYCMYIPLLLYFNDDDGDELLPVRLVTTTVRLPD